MGDCGALSARGGKYKAGGSQVQSVLRCRVEHCQFLEKRGYNVQARFWRHKRCHLGSRPLENEDVARLEGTITQRDPKFAATRARNAGGCGPIVDRF